MAQVSSIISNAFFFAVIVAVFSAMASSAQEYDLAPAPTPDSVTGAGFSLPVSGAVIGTSLLFSLLGLLRH